MKKDFARQSASQADSVSRNIDEARQALKDSFQQQQVDLKAQILEQAQKQLEEYKRDLEVSAQKARRETTSDLTSKIGMETAMRNHQEACEAEFKQNALRYRDSIQAENAKETTLLQAMIDRLRSEKLPWPVSMTVERDWNSKSRRNRIEKPMSGRFWKETSTTSKLKRRSSEKRTTKQLMKSFN